MPFPDAAPAGAIHPSAAFRGRPVVDLLRPSDHVRVGLHLEELLRIVETVQHELPVPGVRRHVRDVVRLAAEERPRREIPVEHVELALDLHGVAVDGVLELLRCVGVEMAEAAAEIGCGSHLPEQPGQALRPLRAARRDERVELLRQVEKNRGGLEHARGRGRAAVEQAGDLRVRVDVDEPAAELVPLADVDEPGVVLRLLDAERQELLQQDRHLHAVRRPEGVELQRMLADGELLLVGGAGDGPVDAGEAAAALGFPLPDFGWDVLGGLGHGGSPGYWASMLMRWVREVQMGRRWPLRRGRTRLPSACPLTGRVSG